MPKDLVRYQQTGDLHFVTFSCYRSFRISVLRRCANSSKSLKSEMGGPRFCGGAMKSRPPAQRVIAQAIIEEVQVQVRHKRRRPKHK